MERSRRNEVAGGALLAAAAAYAWWAAGLRPFTWAALAAVGSAGVFAIALGSRGRKPAGGEAPGVLVWAILAVLVAGWELAAYLQAPRADHPTLSSLANELLDGRPVRALAFLVWVVAGVDLARR